MKVGDQVWYVDKNYGIAVQCTIEEVDQISPNSFKFYWLDEPIGYGVIADELYLNRKDAETILLNCSKSIDLKDYRKKKIHFIESTWPPGKKWDFPLKEKIKGIHWIN